MDDISEAFRSISMDDFIRDTSAVKVVDLTLEQQTSTGLDSFHKFTNALIEGCTDSLEQGAFTAFGVLHNATHERYFYPDDDETAYHFAARLKREASMMTATWCFAAVMTPGRTYNSTDEDLLEPIDPDNREQISDLLAAGILQVGVCWYSEIHEDDVRHRRSGMIMADNPEEQVEGDIDAEHNPFHQILDRE
jgi:hypothetical protein